MAAINYNEEFFKATEFRKIVELLPKVSHFVRKGYIETEGAELFNFVHDIETTKFLVQNGVDVNAKIDEAGTTPLWHALSRPHKLELIKLLLENGASSRTRCKLDMSCPLNRGTQRIHCGVEVIQLLLEYGADVNSTNRDCNLPLHNAMHNGNIPVAKFLLESGSLVNFRNKNGDTPLSVALQHPKCTLEWVKLLLKFKAKVNTINFKGNTPLHKAAVILPYYEHDIIMELIKHGARLDVRNNAGDLPMDLAFFKCRDKTFTIGRILIKYTLLHDCNIVYRSISNRHRGPGFDNLASYYNDCSLELYEMRKDRISDDLSLFNFITSKSDSTCVSTKLYKILKLDKYPIYYDIIREKAKRANVLDKLMQERIYTVVLRDNCHWMIFLDSLSVFCIARYLDYIDIKNLAITYHSISKPNEPFWENKKRQKLDSDSIKTVHPSIPRYNS
ncbi:hypothetical protein CDAR_606651 [Caerostris darwini]|uniref:Uncharacterized protein n=1 Tax=Caerostris darwini TaxID=1538125 RepID=A0AAV4PB34_9ARAC|nr:hypothetical protein CDAR_606651 [Caerostris darwini]